MAASGFRSFQLALDGSQPLGPGLPRPLLTQQVILLLLQIFQRRFDGLDGFKVGMSNSSPSMVRVFSGSTASL